MSKEFVDAIVARVSAAMMPPWLKGEKMTDARTDEETRKRIEALRQRREAFAAGWNAHARHSKALSLEFCFTQFEKKRGKS